MDETQDLWANARSLLDEKHKAKLTQLETQAGSASASTIDIDAIILSAQDRRDECEKRGWTIRIGQHEWKLRDCATKIITWLKVFKEVGDTVVQYDPVHSALPWAAFRFILQATISEQEQMGAILVIMEKTSKLVLRGRIFEDLYTTKTIKSRESTEYKHLAQFREQLTRLYKAILESLAICYEQLSSRTAKRALRAVFKPGEMQTYLDELEDVEKAVVNESLLCEALRSENASQHLEHLLQKLDAPLFRIEDQVSRVLAQVTVDEQLHTLEWMSAIPFGRHHDEVSRRRTKGTGEWMLKHKRFKEWHSTSSSAIMLVYGDPGAGKTFLVSKIIDWVRDGLINETTDEAFAYFYCNRNEDNRRSPESILCSLVRQLSSTATPENRLHKAFRGLKTKLALEGRSPDTEVCKDVLSTLIDTYPATTIVLDAMDECEEATRGELMGALETLMENSRNPLKILISSRPNEDIKDYFQERPHIEIQATDNQGDIEDFVREKISQSKHLRALSESLKEEIMKTLFEESDGMFQWAALQILQIEELAKTSWSSENDITERLGKLPKNLRATYDEIWDMIQRKPGRGRMLAERAIQWVLSAYVPLSTAQLASAILIDPYSDDLDGSGKQLTEKAIFELCENLLTVDMELEVWRFSHLSAREYVEEHRFTPNRSDSFVGMACLRYLIIFPCTWSGHREFYDEPPEVESFSDASDISSDDEVLSSRRYRYTNRYNRLGESYEDRILRSKGQWPEENCLCMYVAGNWMFHVKLQEEVKDIDNTRLKHLLKQFFGSLQNSSRAYQAWFNMVQHLEWRYKLKFKYHHIFQCFDSSSKRSAHLEPVSSPIFGMCCLGLFQLLLDWWEDPGTNLDSCNQYGASLLSLALIFRQEPIWRYLLRQKVRVEQGSPRPLLEAVLSGSIPAVTALLEAGSKVNFVDNQYFQAHSPLEAALKSDDTKIAQLLLDHKADVNLRTPSGLPLDYALDFRRFEFASTLLKAGANISGLDEKLFEMAEHGDCEWISILIERGANPDINMRSSTPLIGAIREGHADAVKLLLKSGADVNLIVSLSGSALTAAAENHDLDIIKLLLEAGADPRLNNGHRSPLTKAVPELLTNEKDLVLSKKTIQALLDAGADLNQVVTSDGGVTALDKAARSRTGSAKSSPDQYYASLCKFLLDAGADPNIGTESRRPLHTAIWGQNMEVVKLLVEAGADLNPINSPHLNYLYEAACIASPEILPFLLRAGANANPKNAAANPLCRVVQGGDGNALSRLLEAGCDPSILLDGGYGSVLSAAAFFGRLKACKILLEPKRGVQVETETKGWFKNALMAAIAGHQWYRSRGFAWNALSPERLQIHAYAMDHQAVIRLFLRSGAAVPTPLCPRLGDLTIPVRVGDEYHLCQVAGLMHRRGKCMQWRPFLQAWAAITWHLESGLGPRLPLRLQLHRCGLVRSLPFKAMILMRFIHITQPEEAKFVLIVLRREKSDHYTWNAPVRRVASKIETPPSVKSAPKLILLPSEKLASLAQVSLLEKLSPRPNGGVGWSKQLETRRYRGSAAGLSWSMVLFIGFSALLWSWFWGGRREIPTGQEF